MYNAPHINDTLEAIKPELFKAPSQKAFNETIRRSFRAYNIRCRAFKKDIPHDDYYIGGLYAGDKDAIYLQFHVSKKTDVLQIEDSWVAFKFLFSQTLQHEVIHRHQCFQREDEWIDGGIPLDHRYFDSIGLEEERDYLRDDDEIEAYSHDIAMEIKYYYASHNPLDILRSIDRKRKVWSYSYYKKTFKDVPEWKAIKRKLLKKTYLWLPHTQVYF